MSQPLDGRRELAQVRHLADADRDHGQEHRVAQPAIGPVAQQRPGPVAVAGKTQYAIDHPADHARHEPLRDAGQQDQRQDVQGDLSPRVGRDALLEQFKQGVEGHVW